ncbi:MAG: hypothetical protein J0I80_15935 [Sphingomonas sp.]|nr:hypothetical protein [Sphingomonas sp.]
MTNDINTLSSRAMVALLTVVFSAVTVLGAVGPAVSGPNSGAANTGLANLSGKSANSLA